MSTFYRVREDLVTRLSVSRLGPYRDCCAGRLDPALDLYLWNMRISSAFFESLHLLEVGLRNCMNDALTDWHARTFNGLEPWYGDPCTPLSERARRSVRVARVKATAGGRPELPGRVVAELMFGFWWSLLAEEYNRSLWRPCLRNAFSSARRTRLHGDLDLMVRLRNRIAHHEPLHNRDLARDYRTLLNTAELISMRFAWFIDSTSRVPTMLAERPGLANR